MSSFWLFWVVQDIFLGLFAHSCFFESLSQSPNNNQTRTSLVVQRLRIRLPTQETQVQSLVQEDSTCN